MMQLVINIDCLIPKNDVVRVAHSAIDQMNLKPLFEKYAGVEGLVYTRLIIFIFNQKLSY
jgi:hypothetical protein